MNIKSPVTQTDNVIEIEKISVEKIIEQYKAIGMYDTMRLFGGLNEISICKCNDTGYRFYFPYSIAGDEKFYDELLKNTGYYHSWRWEHQVAFEKISTNQRILEIGCGSGNFLSKMLNEKQIDCVGLELNSSAAKVAKERGIEVYLQTIEEFSKDLTIEKFDVVCSFQVLEHVCDIKSFFDGALACLKNGGLLIIGVPNNNPYLFKYDKYHTLNLPPHHMGLWNIESLRKLEKIFSIKSEKIVAEPLFEADYFWDVNVEYWKNNNKIVYFLSKCVPMSAKKIRNICMRKMCEGRNILAMYRKY